MPDRHDRPPLSVRPPADLEAWLRDRAAATGQSVSALIVAALTEYRERCQDTTPP